VIRATAGGLEAFAAAALRSLGVGEPDAALAAGVMVRTDLRGIRTHGVHMLPRYAGQVREGGVDPRAETVTVRETAATALLDGGGGLGQVVASRATALAIEKALAHDLAVVSVRNSSHLGACGHYALLLAEAGLVGLVFSSTPVIMKVAGSRGRVIGNGPTAWSAPCAPRPPLVFDAAMSVVAGQKVILHLERGEPLPEGWIVDAQGLPTRDPAAFRAGGALVPIGDHKGSGLALLGEVLSGVLSGGAVASAVWSGGNAARPDVSHALVALNPEAFGPLPDFERRANALVDEIHSAAPGPGCDRVLVPGELEHEAERAGLERGVEFDEVAWGLLAELAGDLSVQDLLEEARIG